jgi:hypothetical protein
MGVLDNRIAVLFGPAWYCLSDSESYIDNKTTVVLLLEVVSNLMLLIDHASWHWCDPDRSIDSFLRKEFTDFELVDVNFAAESSFLALLVQIDLVVLSQEVLSQEE